MKKLSDLSGYCPVFDKLNNSLILIGNATKDTIEKFRKKTLYDADDLRDWVINEIKELAEYEEKLINRHGYSMLDAEVSETRGARCKLIEMFKITEEEWK